ncbi:MAG TPA: ABC transporter permease [Terracidiphilus sp.]|jgi:putative ABC transport system permease protein|nr:ABC transporter permease [Terracidiphilus sp.]
MYSLVKELRFALRSLRKTPGFSLTVMLTLALGIGATTAIFSLVEGILLRPLPFHDPDRLVLLGDHLGKQTGLGVTAREIATYARATSAFASLGGFSGSSYELSGGATPEEVQGARLNASVFATLGVDPMVGRVFTKQEEDERKPVAVISYALWMNRYHSNPQIVGTPLELDRKVYTILGVMPRSFEFPLQDGRLDQAAVWVPLSLTPEEVSEATAGFWGYRIVARIRDGVTKEQAAQDADRVAQQVMREFPPTMSAIRIRGDVRTLRDDAVAGAGPMLRALFIAVSVVLLIACANVAGLLLVRSIRRRREYALRLALGARSSAILRESVLEGLLLSVAGGLLGLGFAAVAIRLALRLLPDSMPRVNSIAMDSGVAAFALLLSLATGALCSLAPAFAALRTNLTESIKEGAGTGTEARSHGWLRSALVVAEIAVALVLLTVCGAFLRSYQKMLSVDPGFRPDHVLVARYRLLLNEYPTEDSAIAFNQSVLDKLANKPGITAVGISDSVPASDFTAQSAYTIEGQPTEGWKLKFAAFEIVQGDYFQSMGISLVEGRVFTRDDRANAPLVIMVNETMAKDCWPGQNAIGKRMHVGNPKKGYPWATVVGVVADTKTGARDEPSLDQWYASVEQPAILNGSSYDGRLATPAGGFISLRSVLPPEQMIQTLRTTVAEVDPLLALQDVHTMTDVMSGVEAPRRFNTDLITAFAAAALLLALTGIYAVMAFSVSLRTQEIAIRMALGAQRSGIARLVLASSVKLALLGCALGVVGSAALSRVVRSFLFEVSPTDPWVYTSSVVVMLALALAAAAIPARRAASADPVKALRSA